VARSLTKASPNATLHNILKLAEVLGWTRASSSTASALPDATLLRGR
jgi:hypothetical protein